MCRYLGCVVCVPRTYTQGGVYHTVYEPVVPSVLHGFLVYSSPGFMIQVYFTVVRIIVQLIGIYCTGFASGPVLGRSILWSLSVFSFCSAVQGIFD